MKPMHAPVPDTFEEDAAGLMAHRLATIARGQGSETAIAEARGCIGASFAFIRVTAGTEALRAILAQALVDCVRLAERDGGRR